MSDNFTVAEVLVNSAVKTVGKREFLKTVEKLFGKKDSEKDVRVKADVPAEDKCIARMKGDRTGVKVGRYVLFDAVRCERKQVSNNLCAIHSNQVVKFGELPLGLYADPVTEELKKVFGEI
jgi:hypothetical protein